MNKFIIVFLLILTSCGISNINDSIFSSNQINNQNFQKDKRGLLLTESEYEKIGYNIYNYLKFNQLGLISVNKMDFQSAVNYLLKAKDLTIRESDIEKFLYSSEYNIGEALTKNELDIIKEDICVGEVQIYTLLSVCYLGIGNDHLASKYRKDSLPILKKVIEKGYGDNDTLGLPIKDLYKIIKSHNCAFNNKRYTIPKNGYCSTENKNNAWLCDVGYREYGNLCVKATRSGRCDIKGNVSYSTGEKIYHVKGCENYADTKINTRYGERYFCSEYEAQEHGWRKSRNCF